MYWSAEHEHVKVAHRDSRSDCGSTVLCRAVQGAADYCCLSRVWAPCFAPAYTGRNTLNLRCISARYIISAHSTLHIGCICLELPTHDGYSEEPHSKNCRDESTAHTNMTALGFRVSIGTGTELFFHTTRIMVNNAALFDLAFFNKI